MTVIVLVQSSQSATWKALPGSYPTFQDARDMVQFICGTYGPDASFAIEHADDLARKGYVTA